MAIFANGENLRNEGLQCMASKDYDRAIRSFTNAIKKGDYESIVLLADAKWNHGGKEEAIQDLKRYMDDDMLGLSGSIKIDILKRLIKFDSQNTRIYRHQAAYLNDFDSMRYMFDCTKESDHEVAAEWVDKIICHDMCNENIRYEIMDNFEKCFQPYLFTEEKKDGCYYAMTNETIGKFTRTRILSEIAECNVASINRKGYALCELGRMSLIKCICIGKDEKDKVEYYRKKALHTREYFEKAFACGYLPAHYYMAVLFYAGIDGDVNIDEAKKHLEILLKDETLFYNSGLLQTVMVDDIYAFSSYIKSKYFLLLRKEELNKIIGQTVFKERVNNEINRISNRYDTFSYNSCFRKLEFPNRQMEHKIFILNGQPSNCKRHLTATYCYILYELYKIYNNAYSLNKPILTEIKTVDLDSIGGLEFKINHIRKIITDETDNKNFKFVYFDQPYNITDPKGENYYYIIMNNLVREVIASQDKVLFLAGDGDLIEEELKAIGVREFYYKDDIIDFNGYSESEVLQHLDNFNDQGKIDYDEAIKSEICKIVKMRNQQYPTNIDYDEIRDISRVLNDVYYSLNPEYRDSLRNYQDAFKEIGSRLRIEKISESIMNEATSELNNLIGLKNVKDEVQKIIDTVKINNKRREMGLKPMTRSMHMVFYGNPGTGKTTVARLMGKILKELGVLEKGHLIEKSRGDLVSQYFGATAGKTKEILKQALNGVLFIDEAYTLTNGRDGGNMKDYGQEAVEEILKFMSDKEGKIVVIVAGYKEEMQEFLKSNPGLESRFTTKLEFENYRSEELYEIFKHLCEENEFDIEDGSREYILEQFNNIIQQNKKTFGNARFVNQYFAEITKQRSQDLVKKMNNPENYNFTIEELRLLPKSLFEHFKFRD
ncbi:MAG: AAA family ATPase [Blautia hansenii]